MSLLKRLIQSGDCVLYADYRSGSKDDIEQRFSGTLSNNKMDGGGIHNPDNGKVSYPHSGDIATLTSFSVIIVADFKKVKTGQYLRPVSKRSVAGNHFDLSVDASNITFNNGVSTLSKAIDLEDARSLGFVYDDGSSVSYYKNGISNGTPMSVVSNISAYNTPLTVGSSNLSNNNYGRYLVRACAVFNKVLTATEVAQLTAELELGSHALARVSEKTFSSEITNTFDGSSTKHAGAKLLTGKSNVRIVTKIKTGNNVASLQYVLGEIYAAVNGIVIQNAIKAQLKINGVQQTMIHLNGTIAANTEYEVDMGYNSATGVFHSEVDGSRQEITGLSGTVADVLAYFAMGGYVTPALASGQFFTGKIKRTLVYVDDSVVWDSQSHGNWIGYAQEERTPELYFKGEMGITANEVTTTSGHLENSQLTVASGSFKVIDDTFNGRRCKVIECVSTGNLVVLEADSKLTGWSRYIDSGSGYAQVTSALGTAKTIALTTGDKLIYASEHEPYSLYQS